MPSIINTENEIKEIDLLDLFPATEGFIDQYYGRIRQGKTYGATADILNDLRRGKIVYCNWKINWGGYDQREDPWSVLWHLITGSENYFVFDKSNLRYLPIDENFMNTFETLTDCKVYLDEGHVIFDSYQHAKFSMKKRVAILHTGHFDRSIIIISQRPTAVHVSARANVNRFFRFKKLWGFGFNLFQRTEFQDMINETVDEDSDPLSTKLYIGSSRVYKAYDTKYLRGDTPRSQDLKGKVYKVNYLSQWWLIIRPFWKKIFELRSLKRAKQEEKKSIKSPLKMVIEKKLSTEREQLPW